MGSPVKSAESDRKEYHESCPEVGGVTYRPGVYKMPMVRMTSGNGLTKLRMYGSKRTAYRNVCIAFSGEPEGEK